jgi:membrane protein
LWQLLRAGDLSNAALWMKILVYPVRILVRAVEEFFNDNCILRASSLAYASLLAMVPVTAIFFFSFTKFDAFGKDIKESVEDLIFNNLVPTKTDTIRNYITEHTENVNIIGVFGVITLFVMAIFLFNTIEHTINDIWHAKKRRPFLSKFLAFWTVLTATPLLVAGSSYAASKMTAQVSFSFLPYILNWLAFWFVYQSIPYTKVSFRAAFTGAIVGGTLWQLAKGAFSWYIGKYATFDVLYGSLGAAPVFLIWLYLTWIIVLFGAEVAYAVQYPSEKRKMTREELASYLDYYSVLAMAEIARRFSDSECEEYDTIDALRNIGIPAEILGDILNRLSEEHLILYTEDKNYVPARQPSKIMIREVIESVSGKRMLAPDNSNDAISKRLCEVFKKFDEGAGLMLDEISLETLVSGTGK